MTIGVVIPTRGNRPVFLQQAKYLLSNQTRKPDHIEVVDYPPTTDGIDLVQRYKIGLKKLFDKGCDLAFCWEDDDWYSPIYLEVMENKWILFGKPDLFGIGCTVYYHLESKKYLEIFHPTKASMFSTAMTKKILEFDFDSSDQYLDHFLWVNLSGKIKSFTYTIPRNGKPLCIGMKHGSGMVAGGAHEPDSKYYQKLDFDYIYLKNAVGPDFAFYSRTIFALEYSKKVHFGVYGPVNGVNSSVNLVNSPVNTHTILYYTILKKIYIGETPFTEEETPKKEEFTGFTVPETQNKPFLTIITRCYKRPNGFSNNQKSISELKEPDFEQIFIKDTKGIGLLEANKSFGFVSNLIDGKYVHLLDDDDFLTNPLMISDLKEISEEHDPDVIFFRMTIKNGQNNNYYPTDELCWGKKPIIARIGGSCFVVKAEIYKKFIHHFAKPRCGDYYFIEAVFNSGASVYWLDKKMCETGKVSRGKPE